MSPLKLLQSDNMLRIVVAAETFQAEMFPLKLSFELNKLEKSVIPLTSQSWMGTPGDALSTHVAPVASPPRQLLFEIALLKRNGFVNGDVIPRALPARVVPTTHARNVRVFVHARDPRDSRSPVAFSRLARRARVVARATSSASSSSSAS